MKKLFSILVLALSCSALFAQQTTVALLNHEGTISTFYGADALTQAHKAAVHGDIITLSGGAFTAPSSWTKAVTLRGAGCYEDAENTREVTFIGNAFKLAIPVEIETTMTIEGIYFKSDFSFSTRVKNTTFLKCHFTKVSSVSCNTNFYNCILNGLSFSASATEIANVNLFNCYVNDPHNTDSYVSAKFTNCIVRFSATDSYNSRLYNRKDIIWKLAYAKYTNCIFIGNLLTNYDNNDHPSIYNIPSTCTATNCLSCYCAYKNATETEDAIYDYNIFDEMGNSTNQYLENGKPIHETITSVFKTYNGTDWFTFNELYELTDEAKATYLGSDGTQVGLYGGMGFDLIPSTLQITKCEVSPRSTKDGKISVSIEVGIPE